VRREDLVEVELVLVIIGVEEGDMSEEPGHFLVMETADGHIALMKVEQLIMAQMSKQNAF